MKTNRLHLIFALVLLLTLMACTSTTTSPGSNTMETATAGGETAVPVPPATTSTESTPHTTRPAGWSDATHSNTATPDYNTVFPQDQVNQMTITITPADWAAMQANLTELLGEPGQQTQRGAPDEGVPGNFLSENPTWVAATIEFAGNTWTNVGIRYKGNSSLQSSWNNGSLKLPLKLDFDEFEDTYPEIENQRFYGFQQLSLANGFGDDSYLRETIAYDLLAKAGLPAAQIAYYELILDYGTGPVNLGLYVMIEVIDDTVIERTFGDDGGNIYEIDGPAGSLATGTAEQIADSFQKENNEDEADWSDIESLYHLLHATTRTTAPETWRADLEAVFDIDTFLEWLALSAVLQHWDTYGRMSHNFYLYHNPDTDRLTWISWDHNQVLGGMGNMGGGPPMAPNNGTAPAAGAPPDVAGRAEGMPGRGMGQDNVSLDKAEVDESWPLIRYLLDDPTYQARYLDYLAEASHLFNPDELATTYQTLATLIQPYVIQETSAAEFETAVQQLTDRTYERAQTLTDFLQGQ